LSKQSASANLVLALPSCHGGMKEEGLLHQLAGDHAHLAVKGFFHTDLSWTSGVYVSQTAEWCSVIRMWTLSHLWNHFPQLDL